MFLHRGWCIVVIIISVKNLIKTFKTYNGAKEHILKLLLSSLYQKKELFACIDLILVLMYYIFFKSTYFYMKKRLFS